MRLPAKSSGCIGFGTGENLWADDGAGRTRITWITESVEEMAKQERNFPHHLDGRSGELVFVGLDQDTLLEAPFHDQRLTRDLPEIGREPVEAWAEQSGAESPGWLFHTGFCGSTLMARGLATGEAALVLREPMVVTELSDLLRSGHPIAEDRQRRRRWLRGTTTALAAHAGGGRVVIKPTNTITNLMAPLLEDLPGTQAVLLYQEMEEFLLSILNKGLAGRMYVRQLYRSLTMDPGPYQVQDYRRPLVLADLQIAALAWSAQVEAMVSLSARQPAARMLRADAFFADPAALLAVVDRHLGGTGEFDGDRLHGVLGRHAKYSAADYSASQRAAERAAVRDRHVGELEATLAWAADNLRQPQLPPASDHLSAGSTSLHSPG